LAAAWSQEPQPASQCDIDADLDGSPDCILANEQVLLILQPVGGRLLAAFTRRGADPIQLIGPTTQESAGLGDPGQWDPGAGLAADPDAIPGAFSDRAALWDPYTPANSSGQVVFTSPAGWQKSYRLEGSRLSVEYAGTPSGTTLIPILINPTGRYQPGWGSRYRLETLTDGDRYLWELEGSARVRIQTSSNSLIKVFNESKTFMVLEEDPDQDYPAGHYLPFPFAYIEVEREGDTQIMISFEVLDPHGQ
jgi:hypothetical protein